MGISSFYSRLDKGLGGYLPGGVKPGSTTTTTKLPSTNISTSKNIDYYKPKGQEGYEIITGTTPIPDKGAGIILGGGGSSGGGSGGSPVPQPTSSSPQRETAGARKVEIRREQVEVEKIKRMTPAERNIYFKDSAIYSKASATEKLLAQGKTPTPEYKKAYDMFKSPSLSSVGFEPSGETETQQPKEQGKIGSFFSSFISPPKSFSEIEKLPESKRGLESAKSIFTGGFFAISEKLKRSSKEVSVGVPLFGGLGFKKVGSFSPGKVASELIPTTPAEFILIGGYSKLPKIARIGTATGVSALGVSGVITAPTKEAKIASGIIAVGGATGSIFEATPYIRGLKAQTIGRVTGEFSPIKTQTEGFKAIELKETKIGLIEPGSPSRTGITSGINLPKTSPLVRGGFEVKPSEKFLFLGEGQTVATSQRGLFKVGETFKPTPESPPEFFVTPQEPTLKIPETRVSRLALDEGLFSFPKRSDIGFGLPPKSQIGLEFGAKISRSERKGSFRIGTGTELEAIKTRPTIKTIERLGVTTIGGRGIDIFKIETSKTKGGSLFKPTTSTNLGTTKVSGESIFSLRTPTRRTASTTTRTAAFKPTTSLLTTRKFFIPSGITSSKKTPGIKSPFTPTREFSDLTRPTKIKSPPSTPLIPTSKLPPTRRPPITPPRIYFNPKKIKSPLKKTKRKTKAPPRRPSLFAIGTGLKSTRKGLVESSGLTIRPILVTKRRKKVNGKKKKRTN